jgi:hypothetical protein
MILSRINKEIGIFVGANQDDNESIISNFFEVLDESLDNATGKKLTRKGVLDSYQKVMLVVDEMIQDGIIINTDGQSIDEKVFMKTEEKSTGGYFSSLVGFAKNQLSSAIRK